MFGTTAKLVIVAEADEIVIRGVAVVSSATVPPDGTRFDPPPPPAPVRVVARMSLTGWPPPPP